MFQEANETVLQYLGLKLGIWEEYSVEYLAEMQTEFLKVTGTTQEQFVHWSRKRNTPFQRLYERMDNIRKKLKGYREKVEICGGKRNNFLVKLGQFPIQVDVGPGAFILIGTVGAALSPEQSAESEISCCLGR